jgi:hypothetical protein
MISRRGSASMKILSHRPDFAVVAHLWLAFLAGCSNRPPAVALPSVDASEVASLAMERYDADHNDKIDAAEKARCPPLAAALDNYDADNNGQLSAQEIEDRMNKLYGSNAALANVKCTVTLSGRPLRGAIVKFRPVEMLESSIKPAQGLTNDSGVARIALAAEELPDDLQDARLMQPGLYHVEITHPNIALLARYNTETELGFEVDPSKERTGTSARFDLRPK